MSDKAQKEDSSNDGSDNTPEKKNTTTTAHNKKARTNTPITIPARPSNYQSLRRQCNRSKSNTATPQTLSNLRTLPTTYSSRVTLKLSIPPSKDPFNAMLDSLKDFLTNIKEASQGKIGLIAWKSNDIPLNHALLEPSHIPTTLSKLLLYSPRLFPGKINKQNSVYAKIHIAHESLFTDIQSELDYWLRSNSHGLYYNMLQAETVVDIGWLLYSLRCMDAGALAEEIFDLYGIEVGLRWKVINQGLKGKIPAEQRISALHVEASLENKSKTIKALLELYGRTTTKNSIKPNGVNFRFVTLRSSATSRSSTNKLDRLRTRQKKFLSKICQSSSWDIMQLDHIIKEGTPSLRNLIMDLKSTEYEEVSTFHSVDLDYNGDGFVFTYLPEIRAEAEAAIQTLFPLIRHHNNDSHNLLNDNTNPDTSNTSSTDRSLTELQIQTFFTQEAIDRTEDMYFDNSKQCIIDPLIDGNLELVIDDDTFEKLLGPDIEETVFPASDVLTPGRPAPRVLTSSIIPQGDDDSISTFGGSLYDRNNATSNRSRQRLNSRIPSSDSSAISSNTAITNDEFNSLNNQVQSITLKLSESQSQNNEILKLLRLNIPPSTDSAGPLSSADSDAGDTFGDASDGFD